MLKLDSVLQKLISSYQENQGGKRKKLDVNKFEEEIIKTVGSQEKYNTLGGYREFHKCIQDLKNSGTLKPIVSSKESNNKRPVLHRFWWLESKYSEDQWDINVIARLSTMLDITFYIRNKKYQSKAELAKIECLYRYLKEPCNNYTLIREELSLNIFNSISNLLDYEPEKYLSSSEGKTLLSRLNLTEKDLDCETVKEPFVHWINEKATDDDKLQVLIIEGLATYHTLIKILKKGLKWKLGPVPYILIWGAGRRIEGTIDYLFEIAEDPGNMNIRYAGDIDSEGLDIYYNLKKKNSHLNITLATQFYDFLTLYGYNYSKNIYTAQKKIDSVLKEIENEFHNNLDTYGKLKYLWFNKKRIPQEFINLKTLIDEGWVYFV